MLLIMSTEKSLFVFYPLVVQSLIKLTPSLDLSLSPAHYYLVLTSGTLFAIFFLLPSFLFPFLTFINLLHPIPVFIPANIASIEFPSSPIVDRATPPLSPPFFLVFSSQRHKSFLPFSSVMVTNYSSLISVFLLPSFWC